MKVLKFGGSSVGSSESILQVIDILQKQENQQNIVVLSAFQGATDTLNKCASLASSHDLTYRNYFDTFKNRHVDIVKSIVPVSGQNTILEEIKVVFKELQELLLGIYLLQEITPKILDNVLSFGERLSSCIIHRIICYKGMKATLIDSRQLIKTDFSYGAGIVNRKETAKRIKSKLEKCNHLTVVSGFIASAPDGTTSTLGRGGSDYTSSLFAASLKVEMLEIWTDVNGVLTASPSKVSTAIPIEELSYQEAMELSHFGAKVIYPPTIQPVMDANVPIRVKNTFNPFSMGTLIQRKAKNHKHLITGLSSIEEVALLTLSGSGMVGVSGFAQRMFSVLADKSVNVILITQASSEHSITIVIEEKNIAVVVESLENEFAFEISLRQINPIEVKKDKVIVALVGENIKQHIGIAGKAFSALGQNGVNINAIAQGSTEHNISIVMDRIDEKKSLNALHEKFFLTHLKKLNLYIIGIGGVGNELIRQISEQEEYLKEKHHVLLRIIAVANSKKMLFNQSGVNPKGYKNTLIRNGKTMHLDNFLTQMKTDGLHNSIFVDNTSSEVIAKSYQKILKSNISVVTPNKIALSLNHEVYVKIKDQARKNNVKFLYETNVGAGLPVINTITDLRKSGDEILKIEAVLSGSLNFIFNEFVNKAISFREIVEIAMKKGYTEPDPRIDLNSVDVKRKILILARESGASVEMSDIDGVNFLPKGCLNNTSIEEFLSSIEENEAHFEKLKKDAIAVGGKLRYIAKFEAGKLETKLEIVEANHPFYHLNGTDNIILLTTKRYNKFPMVIQGAGAGTEVTAAGVFADIMRIANR